MRIGIVGAGITGLALTHYLDRRGVDSVAFEADARAGGVIRTVHRDGRVLECGPQRMRLTDEVGSLVAALGLEDELLRAPDDLPLWVYVDGRLREVPRTVGGFLRTDLLSRRGKLRILAEPLTTPGRTDETAADMFARKFGREAYRRMIEPLFGGIYGSDPAEMPVRHALSGLLAFEERPGGLLKPAIERLVMGDPPPAVSFDDGMTRFPEALAAEHRDRVELETPVSGIGGEGDGFVVETAGGTVDVDRVVVTAPADVAADLLSGVAVGADGLAALNYNPLAIVHVEAALDEAGFGYQIGRDEGFRTLGVSWNASLFDRDDVYTCFLGGMPDPGVVEEPADAIGRLACEEFEAITGREAGVLAVNRLERGFPAYDRSWAALDRVELPPGVHLATNYTGRIGIPSRVREAKRLAESVATG